MAKEEFLHIRIDADTLNIYQKLCQEHASNPSAMTRKLIADWVEAELQSILQNTDAVYLSSAELESVLPEVYSALYDRLYGWVEDTSNTASDEDIEAFEAGQYWVEILFNEDGVYYTAGRDEQELANQPPWIVDKWSDFLGFAPKEWLVKIIKN